MAAKRTPSQQRELNDLLTRDHTLNGAILFGLDGHLVEMQARAMEILREPRLLANVTKISGMAPQGVRESLDRIAGAVAKLQLAEREVTVMVNLAPADLPNDSSWLDLPQFERRRSLFTRTRLPATHGTGTRRLSTPVETNRQNTCIDNGDYI